MKYFKNTSWLFGEKILRMIVGLFVGIWVARYLGPEQFGLFSYAGSFVGLFTAFATLGLDSIVVRELVKDENRRDELIGTAFYLKLMGAFGVLALLAIAVNFTSNDTLTNTLVFIIASATVFQSFNVVDMYFQSKVMSKYVVYANIISLLISSITKVVLLLNEAPLVTFAWVILFDSLVLAMGFIYFYIKNNLSVLNWKFDKIVAISLLKDSWPLMFTVIMVMVYLNLIPILLKYYLNDLTLIAHYQVALRIAILIDFIPIILVNSIFPYLVQSSLDTKSYLNNLQIISNYFNLIVLFYSIALIVFSKEIILLLYGKDYLYSAELFKYMVLLNFFSFHGYLSGRYYIIAKLEKQYLLRVILGLLVLLISSIYLIPKYKVEGAIMSLLLSEFMVVFISDIFNLNKTKDILMIKLKSLYLFINYKSYTRNSK